MSMPLAMHGRAPHLAQSALAHRAQTPSSETPVTPETAIAVQDLSLFYGQPGGRQALCNLSLDIPARQVTAFIGPSGCGKSSLLRCFNRMNDLVEHCRSSGRILIAGEDIRTFDAAELRRRVGMVFQKPNPFPKSIYDNVAYGPRLGGVRARRVLDETVEQALVRAALWDEVKDRLHASALSLSGGQQQRLVIARALAVEPQILLLDEPCSALDPISTLKIEELIVSLKSELTIVMVTHNMQQAARVSDCTAFLYLGRLIEFDSSDIIFTRPAHKQTEDYLTGRYG